MFGANNRVQSLSSLDTVNQPSSIEHFLESLTLQLQGRLPHTAKSTKLSLFYSTGTMWESEIDRYAVHNYCSCV